MYNFLVKVVNSSILYTRHEISYIKLVVLVLEYIMRECNTPHSLAIGKSNISRNSFQLQTRRNGTFKHTPYSAEVLQGDSCWNEVPCGQRLHPPRPSRQEHTGLQREDLQGNDKLWSWEGQLVRIHNLHMPCLWSMWNADCGIEINCPSWFP